MKYVSLTCKIAEEYAAQFSSGTTSRSHDAACFFMALEDAGVLPGDIDGHIVIGEQTDPTGHDWTEIRRIAETFTKGEAA